MWIGHIIQYNNIEFKREVGSKQRRHLSRCPEKV